MQVYTIKNMSAPSELLYYCIINSRTVHYSFIEPHFALARQLAVSQSCIITY